MPGTSGAAGDTLTGDDILATLGDALPTWARPAVRVVRPRPQLWLVDGGPATVGIIASVSHAFCAACDRTRLTADGQVRNCLFASTETDLRALLRDGADDDDARGGLAARRCGARPPGHGINDPGFVQPDRPMSAIGG